MVPTKGILDTVLPVVLKPGGKPPKNKPPAGPGALMTVAPSGNVAVACKASSTLSSRRLPSLETATEWNCLSAYSELVLASRTSPRPAFNLTSNWPLRKLTV